MTPDFLLERFRGARKAGLATPDQPRSRRWFIEKIKEHHDVDVDDRTFRDTVHQLADQHHPICTTNAGIFYALTAEEMEPAIQYLVSYAREIEKRIRALKDTQETLRQKDADLFSHPLVKALRDEFGAEKI